MADITITVTEIADGISVEADPVSITVYDGVFVDTGGGGGGGAVDSVNGETGTVVLSAADVGAATTAQGTKADTAVQPGSLATVATSGAYTDLSGKPTLGTAAPLDVPASGDATSGQVVKGSDTRLTDSRTPTTHTHAESDVTNLTTDLAGKVPTTRTVTAGTGLTGGGDLSANRTLAVAYGTSSTTAAVGNDSRLSDARTPTAHASSHASAGSDPITIAESQVTNLTSDLALKAPLASPTFTGTVTVPTATAADSTTKAASTAYVQGELTAKAPLASPALTGNPTAPTQTAGNNSTRVATTAYVDGTFAPLASPALTGNPTVPTQAAGTNSTRAASTAYVDAAVAAGPIDATKVTHTVNTQTGTTYTLVLGDAGKFVTMSNASASTLTVPPNSSVAFPVGTMLDGAQLGAGQVTLTAGAGVTINATPGLKVAAQYGTFGLLKTATDTWLAYGRLSA